MSANEKLVLFLGSGFSVDFGLPVTSKLQDQLLELGTDPVERPREAFISKQIAAFWNEVFGWRERETRPTLEDHFTQIDFAANSGHYLGRVYGPKRLRALRRMTIHRMFRLLDVEPKPTPHIEALFGEVLSRFDVSVVTTNWDLMVERCFERRQIRFSYGLDREDGTLIWKLHGSGNWGYCDLCRNLITSDITLGKTAVRFGWLLEADDFKLFRGGRRISENLGTAFKECIGCHGATAVRVATFSYRKHLDVPFFQSIWDDARERLRSADRWLFIGYSMPEADIEIRHLLKTAELSHSEPVRPRIDVVLKDDPAAPLRFQRFFGRSIQSISNNGIKNWVETCLEAYCRH